MTVEVPEPVREFARELPAGACHVYAVPLRTRFRGITTREGLLFEGPAGWGEFCPFPEYDDPTAAAWLLAALEAAVLGWPAPVRDRVEVNVTVPVVGPERAHALVAGSGCRTAKVKVADDPAAGPADLAADLARLAAVRDALGPGGAIRVDANAAWDLATATAVIPRLDAAAGGLEYVEQPCAAIPELVELRRRVGVRIAADESIRRAADPLRVDLTGAADVAVLKATPLGGVRRSLAVARAVGLPCVVSSALETGVGLAGQLALAGALPDLELACGLGTVALLSEDLVAPADSPVPRGGVLSVPRRPPSPDPVLLGRYAAAPPRQAWWTDRLRRCLAQLIDAP